MFQFIDARLQPTPAEVTSGFVHKERPKGSGRELGDGDRVRACTRVLLLGWKPFLRRSLAQKTTLEKNFSHIPGEEWPCFGSRVAMSLEKAPMCWD